MLNESVAVTNRPMTRNELVPTTLNTLDGLHGQGLFLTPRSLASFSLHCTLRGPHLGLGIPRLTQNVSSLIIVESHNGGPLGCRFVLASFASSFHHGGRISSFLLVLKLLQGNVEGLGILVAPIQLNGGTNATGRIVAENDGVLPHHNVGVEMDGLLLCHEEIRLVGNDGFGDYAQQ